MSKLKDNKWLTLIIISMGLLIILIDTTVVNVSIPSIINDLHTKLSDVEWVISGYALSFAALLITFGRIGDIYGRKFMYIAGVIVFALASFISGESSNSTMLIYARLFQGVGGAMISPSVLSIISSTFTGKDRSIAFGIFGAITGIAVAIGPILGGFFTTYYSWRWIFRINIPICIIVAILSYFLIYESKSSIKHKLDLSGMFTSSIGFFFLVFGLIEGQNYGWLKPTSNKFSIGDFVWTSTSISIIPIIFVLGFICLLIFIIIEAIKTKKSLEPAINLEFFKIKSFRYGLIAIAIIALGEFSSLFTIPIFWQDVKTYTPLQSGLTTLPLALASFIAAPLSAKLVNRFGSKWIITAGISLECLGLLLISTINPDTTIWIFIIPMLILGAGIGLALAQNTQVILSEIPPQNSGSASGILNTVRQIGSAFGIAIIGAVLSAQITMNIQTQINAISTLPPAVKNNIVNSVNKNNVSYNSSNEIYNPSPAPADIQNNPILLDKYNSTQMDTYNKIKYSINKSLTDSIDIAVRVGAIFMFFGSLLSLLIPNKKHSENLDFIENERIVEEQKIVNIVTENYYPSIFKTKNKII